jgi:hypothetical protein
MCREAIVDLLHELLKHQLDVVIHGVELLLWTGEVIVLLQSGEVTRLVNLIPLVSNRLWWDGTEQRLEREANNRWKNKGENIVVAWGRG